VSSRAAEGHHGGVSDRSAASAAKSVLAARLAAEPGVMGVGLARRARDYVVKVDLADAEAARRVPGSVDGVRVVTEVIGVVRPL
jgi:hypothetical protein